MVAIKSVRKLVLVLVVFLSMENCSKISEDDELSLEKRPYAGDELRLDGYFYRQPPFNQEFGTVYFFLQQWGLFKYWWLVSNPRGT